MIIFFLGPCHKIQNTFQGGIRRGGKEDPRLQHACFFPTVDYGQYYIQYIMV